MPRKANRWGRMPPSLMAAWYRLLLTCTRLNRSKAAFVAILLLAFVSLWYFGSFGARSTSAANRRHLIKAHSHLTPELDYSGDYMVVGPLRSDEGSGHLCSSPGCLLLATHCSPANLHELYSLLDAWHGPISVAIFLDVIAAVGGTAAALSSETDAAAMAELERLLHTLHALLVCHDNVWAYVVYPVAFDGAIGGRISAAADAAAAGYRSSCDSLLADLQAVSRKHAASAGHNYERGGVVPYPGNTLRNVATRRARRDDHVLVVDVDMVPSADLYERLSEFLTSNGGGGSSEEPRTAYVLPCFESKHGKGVSLDRPTLERLWRLGVVRPFYAEACPQCQATTNYERWMALDSGGGGGSDRGSRAGAVRVAYEVERQRSDAWEPFFVARKWQLPAYDERFKQYGYNRISQICEMYMMGFRFFVLDNAFLVHKGFKTELSFHASKKAELENNTRLYRHFRWEMKERYPHGREC